MFFIFLKEMISYCGDDYIELNAFSRKYVIRSLFVTLADRGYLKYTFVALNHGVALSVMHYFIILFYIKSKICNI